MRLRGPLARPTPPHRDPSPALISPALQAEIIELLGQAGLAYLCGKKRLSVVTDVPPRGSHRRPKGKVKPARRAA